MSIFRENNEFGGPLFQVLNEEGKIVDQEARHRLNDELISDFYRWMLKIRVADKRANNLQRVGKMGTYPSVYGQEACQVGSGLALTPKDWLVPTFRETGTMWCFGVPLHKIFLYWMGNENGSAMPPTVNCLPIAITVGGHLPHAVGIAWANKMRGLNDSVVLCSFGDGATSEGDFHAALNFAAVFRTATVFFIQNNHFAISTPRAIQTASATLAQKAFAYGMKAVYVDGNDVLATYLAVKDAVEQARSSGEPILVEAVTYRLGDHTTSDNARLYRDDDEVEAWKPKDPLFRLRSYLETENLWNEEEESAFLAKAQHEVDQEAKIALEYPPLSPLQMFSRLYAEMSPELRRQQEELAQEINGLN